MATSIALKIGRAKTTLAAGLALALCAASASSFAQISPGSPPPIRDGSIVLVPLGSSNPQPVQLIPLDQAPSPYSGRDMDGNALGAPLSPSSAYDIDGNPLGAQPVAPLPAPQSQQNAPLPGTFK